MARTMKIDLPPFTLVGATTRPGLLSQPLHGRFGITLRLDFYDVESLARIVERSAGILGDHDQPEAAREIGARSRGTPRIANRLLRRLRDFAEVAGQSRRSTSTTAREALERLEVDEHGFDELDRRILSTIIEKFGGGPVGVGSIAASLGEDRGTLEDLYEPYLLQAGFLQRTPRGRIASAGGVPAPRDPAAAPRGIAVLGAVIPKFERSNAPLRMTATRSDLVASLLGMTGREMKRGVLIYNPTAGQRNRDGADGRAHRADAGARPGARQRSDFRARRRDRDRPAQVAEGVDLVAVCGGDGTVSEAASRAGGLLGAARGPARRHLERSRARARRYRWGSLRRRSSSSRACPGPCACCYANERPFLLWAGVGLDARIMGHMSLF